MFGLPGAALAMWLAAPKARRAQIGSIMIPAALTAFATGITEPVEFAFIFVAPVLFAVHVVLTGLSMAILNALDAQLGFGFSAGLIDLLLNATKDNTSGLGLILLLGLVYFGLYFGIFYVLITRFNLPTPGRESDPEENTAAHTVPSAAVDKPGTRVDGSLEPPEPGSSGDSGEGRTDGSG